MYTSTLETKRQEASQRTTHKPMLTARDALKEDPGMTKRALVKRARLFVCRDDSEKRLEHASSLQCQGQVFRCCEDTAASIWSSVVQKLPSELLKFSLNAVQDTLPHNENLSRWRKNDGLSSSCKLCGERQTLLHVLNSVATMSTTMLYWDC